MRMNTAAATAGFNPSATADSDLVVRAIAGREESFEELVRRYQRPIAAYVYRMVGDYDSALDLTQEVFIKVYNSLARYRAEYKFSTWIYRIAHNSAIDHLRRHNMRFEDLERSGEDGTSYEKPLASSAPTPEQMSERSERRAEIEGVVQNLPPAYRELITLRHALDFSYDEIAEVTGLPLGTVKNRIFRAREAMREELSRRGITSV
ncbi:MAG TPA: sigma-70 family RNA polymerase sigma factor [Pyrinomonadaceae bacterium]